MADRVVRRGGLGACVLGFVLTFPLFIHVGPAGVGLGQRVFAADRTPGIDLPMSAFAIPIMLALLVLLKRNWTLRWHAVDGLVAVFCGVNGIAYVVGLALGGYASPMRAALSGAFLLQTLLPLSSFYLARVVVGGRFDEAMQRHLGWCGDVIAWTMRFAALSLGLLVAQSVVERGVAGALSERLVDYFGPVNVTKIKRYYPTILAAVSTFYVVRAMVGRSGSGVRTVDISIGLAMGALLPFIWSRAAVLTLLLAWMGVVICAIGWRRGRVAVPVLAGSAAVVGFTGLGIAVIGSSNAIVAERFRETLATGSRISVGDARRAAAAKEALAGNLLAPLGKMYRPRLQLTLAGERYDFPRVGMPENAYLDYADKAGPLALLSFVGILLYLLWRGLGLVYRYWGVVRGARPDQLWLLYGAWSILLALMIWSNLTQLNFTEPYAAFYFWFLLGILVSWDQCQVDRIGR
jgi:hypothetical protein